MKKTPLTNLQKQAIEDFESIGNKYLYANDSKAAAKRFDAALEEYVRKYVLCVTMADAA